MCQLSKKTQGFTLLELLLVLAIVSIMILGTLAMYQIQLRNFKVDKTSLQTQQWLQAGMSFYVDCDKWPSDSIQDPNMVTAMMGESPLTQDECPKYANTIRQYMPIGSDKNGPFPNEYSFGPFGTDGSLFQVSTNIGADSVLQESVGKMIAGRLPNATSSVDSTKTPSTVVVQATVNVPGQAIQGGHGYILDMQMVAMDPSDPNHISHVKDPVAAKECPPNMTAVVVHALTAFEASRDGSITGMKHGAYQAVPETSTDSATNIVTPTLNIEASGKAPDNNVGPNEVLLISACIPKEGK